MRAYANVTRRSVALGGGLALAFALATPATAQGTRTPRRIGILDWLPSATMARLAPLRQRLRELGHVEEQTIVIDYRSAEEQSTRADAMASELVRLGVEVIVAVATPAAHAARKATATIPIVMSAADPVGTGLVKSLARPGENMTGVSTMLPDLAAKRLELLREVLPALTRVGFIASTQDPAGPLFVRETRAAAAPANIQVIDVSIAGANEFEAAFAQLVAARVEAVVAQPIFVTHRARLAALALRHRLPLISDFPSFAQAGTLLSYGPENSAAFERMAIYVDRILNGARPGDLPIEQPSLFQLVINLATARALGMTVPQSVIARADAVIE